MRGRILLPQLIDFHPVRRWLLLSGRIDFDDTLRIGELLSGRIACAGAVSGRILLRNPGRDNAVQAQELLPGRIYGRS